MTPDGLPQQVSQAQAARLAAEQRGQTAEQLLARMIEELELERRSSAEMSEALEAFQREAAQKLAERMQSQGSRFPTLGEGPPQQAQKAGEQMGQAADELDAKRPGQARPSQQQAISELQGLMEGLKQAANPQRADRGQRDGQKGSRQEKVEIPGADDHQAPAEFRKDLLEAMKDKAPETYEQQVKRYYESLVE